MSGKWTMLLLNFLPLLTHISFPLPLPLMPPHHIASSLTTQLPSSPHSFPPLHHAVLPLPYHTSISPPSHQPLSTPASFLPSLPPYSYHTVFITPLPCTISHKCIKVYSQCLSLHSECHYKQQHTRNNGTANGNVFKDYLNKRFSQKIPTSWFAGVGCITTIPIFIIQEEAFRAHGNRASRIVKT